MVDHLVSESNRRQPNPCFCRFVDHSMVVSGTLELLTMEHTFPLSAETINRLIPQFLIPSKKSIVQSQAENFLSIVVCIPFPRQFLIVFLLFSFLA